MAGLRIVIPGVNFTNYVDRAHYPISEDLSVLHYLGGSAATSLVNHAEGFADAPAAGANVVFQPNYAEFSGDHTLAANYIQTAEGDDASTDFTRVAVFRAMSTVNRCIFGEFNGATSGSGILADSSFYAGAAYNDTLLAITRPHEKFNFVAETFTGGVMNTYKGVGGALALVGTEPGGARTPSTVNDERIGGSGNTPSFTGTQRIAAVAKHRTALTQAQVADVYEFFQYYASRVGLDLA